MRFSVKFFTITKKATSLQCVSDWSGGEAVAKWSEAEWSNEARLARNHAKRGGLLQRPN